MELNEMYKYVNERNKDFEQLLKIKDESKRKRRLVKHIMAAVEECGSAFEEQCVIENFKEIYEGYMKKEAGVA